MGIYVRSLIKYLMMKNNKPCKGQGKAKGFEGCSIEVPANSRKYGLCRKCLWIWMQSTDEGEEYYENQFLSKVSKKEEQRKKVADKELKIQFTDWRKKLQSKVQEISRLIDVGLPCLARGYHANQLHGGHIMSRGSNPSMALNIHNIHRQSAQSNHFQNEDGLLREGLIKEYGQDYFEFISSLRRTPSLKYSNLEYHDFYKLACDIANELKKRGQRFELDERIELRNEINLTLGIYEKEFCIYKK